MSREGERESVDPRLAHEEDEHPLHGGDGLKFKLDENVPADQAPTAGFAHTNSITKARKRTKTRTGHLGEREENTE
jgi:hypothetical protein